MGERPRLEIQELTGPRETPSGKTYRFLVDLSGQLGRGALEQFFRQQYPDTKSERHFDYASGPLLGGREPSDEEWQALFDELRAHLSMPPGGTSRYELVLFVRNDGIPAATQAWIERFTSWLETKNIPWSVQTIPEPEHVFDRKPPTTEGETGLIEIQELPPAGAA